VDADNQHIVAGATSRPCRPLSCSAPTGRPDVAYTTSTFRLSWIANEREYFS
jgi:hypothetical protein